MAGIVVDTSVWIEYFAGRPAAGVDDALAHGVVVIPPLVVVELISGAITPAHRAVVGELLQDSPVHATPLAHWIAVGDLRRVLAAKGVNVTVPDAHIAQCALDRDGVLLSRDDVFPLIARHTPLRLQT